MKKLSQIKKEAREADVADIKQFIEACDKTEKQWTVTVYQTPQKVKMISSLWDALRTNWYITCSSCWEECEGVEPEEWEFMCEDCIW